MLKPQRMALVNQGWSELYRGAGKVTGDHAFLKANGWGAERFNHLEGPDDRYYGYIRPSSGYMVRPNPNHKEDWLLVFVSKRENQPGLFITGWYENATFLPDYEPRPEYSTRQGFRLTPDRDKYCYLVEARTAVLVPERLRTMQIATKSMRRTSIMYLAGHGKGSPAKSRLARSVLRQLEILKGVMIANPPPREEDDPTSSDSTRRKEVEDAAMREARIHFEKKGYEVFNHSAKKFGYDLYAKRKLARGEKRELFIEVKGTQAAKPRFLMSRREREFMDDPINCDTWRLLVVTDALNKPKPHPFNRQEAMERFAFSTFTWFGQDMN